MIFGTALSRWSSPRAPRAFVRLAPVLVTVLLLVSCAPPFLGNESGSSGVVKVGQEAPDLALPDLDGETVRLSDYRGQVVLVNFWATWCPPCKAEMPELEAVYQQHRDNGFVIIGVDQRESAEQVRSFIQSGNFSWVFVLDQTGDVSHKYGVFGIPQSYLIDRDGTVKYVWHGALTRGELQDQLEALGVV